jgi:hypothetical protein
VIFLLLARVVFADTLTIDNQSNEDYQLTSTPTYPAHCIMEPDHEFIRHNATYSLLIKPSNNSDCSHPYLFSTLWKLTGSKANNINTFYYEQDSALSKASGANEKVTVSNSNPHSPKITIGGSN